MKRFIVALLLSTELCALNPCYEPITNPYIVPWADTCTCCRYCCGNYEGAAELLYFRSNLCNLDYAICDFRPPEEISADSLPHGRQKGMDLDYKVGFRGYISYISQDCCQDFRLEYTWFHRHYHSGLFTRRDSVFWPTHGHPFGLNVALSDGETKSSLDIDLDAVSLQFAQRSVIACQARFRRFIGIHWFKLEKRWASRYSGSFDFFDGAPDPGTLDLADYRETRKVWGAGPQIGIEGNLPVWCGFGAAGRLWGSVTAGRGRGHLDESLSADLTSLQEPLDIVLENELKGHCAVVPVVDARLGLHYTFCCGHCFQIFLEAGYEFLSYINAIQTVVFTHSGGTSQTVCESYNLDGFYFSLKLKI